MVNLVIRTKSGYEINTPTPLKEAVRCISTWRSGDYEDDVVAFGQEIDGGTLYYVRFGDIECIRHDMPPGEVSVTPIPT